MHNKWLPSSARSHPWPPLSRSPMGTTMIITTDSRLHSKVTKRQAFILYKVRVGWTWQGHTADDDIIIL